MARRSRLVAAAVRPALAGFAATLLALCFLPGIIGWRPVVVLSGSMAPALATGDLLLVRPITPSTAKVGDVIQFDHPDERSTTLTHRVHSVVGSRGTVRFVTRGDANTAVEAWSVERDGRIGRVEYRVPLAGYALRSTGTPLVRVLGVNTAIALLAWSTLRRVWRRVPAVVGHPQQSAAKITPKCPPPENTVASTKASGSTTVVVGRVCGASSPPVRRTPAPAASLEQLRRVRLLLEEQEDKGWRAPGWAGRLDRVEQLALADGRRPVETCEDVEPAVPSALVAGAR
jgi:signal peptidase